MLGIGLDLCSLRGVSGAQGLLLPYAWGFALMGQTAVLKTAPGAETVGDVNSLFSSTTPSDKWLWNGVSAYAVGQTIRQDFDASGNAIGIPTERAATNLVRNPRGEGAANPSTMPTNWSQFIGAGVVRTVVGLSTLAGLPSTDINFAGTATAAAAAAIYYETSSGIAAVSGDTVTASVVLALAAGTSLAGFNAVRLKLLEYDAGGALIVTNTGPNITPSEAVALYKYTATLSGATTAFVRPVLEATYSNGAVVNVTFRSGVPQCVKNGWASSPILPPAGTPGASTRNVDKLKAVHALDISAGFTMHWSGVFDGIDTAALQHAISLANDAAPSFNQRALLAISTNGAAIGISTRDGVQTTLTGTVLTPGVPAKISCAVGAGDGRLVVNGTLAASSGTMGIPNDAMSRLALGSSGTSLGGTPLDGHTRCLALTPLMTTAEMQAFQARMT